MSWGEPSAANGILQAYRVVYEPLAPVQGKAGVGEHCGYSRAHRARATYLGFQDAGKVGPGPRVWDDGSAANMCSANMRA